MIDTDLPAGDADGDSGAPGRPSDETLAALPARVRVHALARLLGSSSREVLAMLARFDVGARSAQSSVDRDTVARVVDELYPSASSPASAVVPPVGAAEVDTVPAETTPTDRGAPSGATAATAGPAGTASPAGPTSATETAPPAEPATPGGTPTPAETPPDVPTGTSVDASTDTPSRAPQPAAPMPMFMAPEADAAPTRPRRRRATRSAGAVTPDESAGTTDAGATDAGTTDAGTTSTARPTSAGTGEAPTTDTAEGAPAGADAPAEAAPTGSGRGRSRRRRATASAATPTDDAEADETPTGEPTPTADESDGSAGADSDSPDDSDDSDDDEGGRRRRRRGRRGRGRGRGSAEDGDSDSDSDSEDTDGSESDDSASPTTGDPGDSSGDGDDSEEESDDAEGTDGSDDDDQSSSGSGSRRRRRRRRRGSDGDGDQGAEADPPNTVTHVRDRSAEKDRPDEGRRRSSDDEVRGVKGSTRLEAKRQRRRDGRDAGRRRPAILSESEFLARREAVERTMVVRQQAGRSQIGVLEDTVLVEHFVAGDGQNSMVGNVYLGRVQNVLPSMEAAFVDIGRGRNAVLYAGEVNWDASGLEGKQRKIEQALSSGDQVLVQVTKDPVGHKGARLTTQISLPGRFLVYVPAGGATGISRKLPDVERKRLKEILKRIVPDESGVIIRTAAEGVSEDDLEGDVERLAAQWTAIERDAEEARKAKGTAPTLVYEEPDLLIRVVRDMFNEDFSSLVISGDRAWDTLEGYISHVAPELAPRLRRHTGGEDVFAAHRIDEQLVKALDRKVWLPSGGTLVIDRTEAMTVVDVNTGKFTGSGGNLEETVTRNNLEAAEEIVRQLRLRDIGGMIVIDFIDMVLESNRDLVLRRLTECLGRDRTRHQVSEVTSLGLVQMTRKRVGQGLLDEFSTVCEHCRGRGVIVSDEPTVGLEQASSGQNQQGQGSGQQGQGQQGGDKPAASNGEGSTGGGRRRGRGRRSAHADAGPPATEGSNGLPADLVASVSRRSGGSSEDDGGSEADPSGANVAEADVAQDGASEDVDVSAETVPATGSNEDPAGTAASTAPDAPVAPVTAAPSGADESEVALETDLAEESVGEPADIPAIVDQAALSEATESEVALETDLAEHSADTPAPAEDPAMAAPEDPAAAAPEDPATATPEDPAAAAPEDTAAATPVGDSATSAPAEVSGSDVGSAATPEPPAGTGAITGAITPRVTGAITPGATPTEAPAPDPAPVAHGAPGTNGGEDAPARPRRRRAASRPAGPPADGDGGPSRADAAGVGVGGS